MFELILLLDLSITKNTKLFLSDLGLVAMKIYCLQLVCIEVWSDSENPIEPNKSSNFAGNEQE